ncbi:MAG: hypothetical protein KF842_07910 [Caulobacter sp.]|nr:hypothetical protein [Caulobacter sp.]
MRLFATLIVLGLSLAGQPALACAEPPKPVPTAYRTAKLDCGSRGSADVRKAIRALPLVQEAPKDQRGFCLYVGKAGDGPWRRFAVVEFQDGAYWCGSAGCQVAVYVEDASGRWREAIKPELFNNAYVKEFGFRIDETRTTQGLPVLAMPQDLDRPDPVFVDWTFDPVEQVYSAPEAP